MGCSEEATHEPEITMPNARHCQEGCKAFRNFYVVQHKNVGIMLRDHIWSCETTSGAASQSIFPAPFFYPLWKRTLFWWHLPTRPHNGIVYQWWLRYDCTVVYCTWSHKPRILVLLFKPCMRVCDILSPSVSSKAPPFSKGNGFYSRLAFLQVCHTQSYLPDSLLIGVCAVFIT